MEVACDLVIALDCILKIMKFQSNLQLIFFYWRHAVVPASISAIGISLLSQVHVSLTLTRVTSCNVSQGSEISENIQSLAAGLFPPSLLSIFH